VGSNGILECKFLPKNGQHTYLVLSVTVTSNLHCSNAVPFNPEAAHSWVVASSTSKSAANAGIHLQRRDGMNVP
jgi:hypothetical protein